MKRIIMLMLVLLMVFGFSACGSKNASQKHNGSVLSNDCLDIDGVYIDTTFEGENTQLVYIFYNLKAKDKNLEAASKYLIELYINDSNEYEASICEDFIPYYTEYYYSEFIENVYVGTSLKVCQTYEIPNGDLNDDKIIKLKTIDGAFGAGKDGVVSVDDLSIYFNDIKALNGIEKIAQDLNEDVYKIKLEKRNKLLAEVDKETEQLVRNGLNDRYWTFISSPSSYKIEFDAPNKFSITMSIAGSSISNTGTYSVRAGCIVLYYPSNNSEVIIEYTCNEDGTPAFDDGYLLMPTITDSFGGNTNYDGRK